MVKSALTLKVTPEFMTYINEIQDNLEKQTGKKFAKVEITAFLACVRPTIKIENDGKKKRRNNDIWGF